MTRPEEVIRLLLVDDHPLILEGLAAVLGQVAHMRVVAQVQDGAAALHAYQRYRPDVTVTDLGLPDMGGAELIARLRGHYPEARFLVLTVRTGGEDIREAIRAGAGGYVLKNAGTIELLRAIEVVHRGGRFFPEAVASGLALGLDEAELSAREREVLRLLASGRRDREIADALFVSPSTVRSHVSRIFAKLGVKSRSQAILAALERGLVRLGRM